MTIWRMRIACWIPKATNTHSQYVIVIAFPLQQRLEESATSLCSTYIAHHQAHSVLQVCASCRLLFLSKQTTCSPQCSPRRCCTNLSFTLYLQTQITPLAILRLIFCTFTSSCAAPLQCTFTHSVDALYVLGESVRQHSEYVWAQVEFTKRVSELSNDSWIFILGLGEVWRFYLRIMRAPHKRPAKTCWTEIRCWRDSRLSAGQCDPFSGTKQISASHGYAAHCERRWLSTCRAGVGIIICGGQSGTGTDCFPSTVIPRLRVNLLTNFSANEDFFRSFSDSANEYGFR